MGEPPTDGLPKGMNVNPFRGAITAHVRVLWQEQQRAEIERAIKTVKRSGWGDEEVATSAGKRCEKVV